MMQKNAPIGVMDSGVGGLSVVLSLQKILPHEDIIYYGDTANCPYGNKSRQELLSLSRHMLTFLENRGVKCVALACNTTSALADVLRPDYTAPIITVAECAADAIGRMGLKSIGLVATVSTVNSGIYETRIHAEDPDVKVYSQGSVHLARLVEENHRATDAVDAEIQTCMQQLLAKGEMQDVILGCTHYPLVKDRFRIACPDLHFIDPAPHQAAYIRDFLQKENIENEVHKPYLTVYTTGDPQVFAKVCKENGLSEHYDAEFLHIDS